MSGVSRLTPLKRADLLLRALAAPDGRGIRAVIAGEGEERPALERLVSELGLEDRVTLAGGVTEAQLLDHLARCRVVCFAPLQEDYGFVAVESFASRKPVVTCTDSGGPAELVADGERGYVCSPTRGARAGAPPKRDDRARRAHGRSALAYVSTMTWAAAVETLTR